MFDQPEPQAVDYDTTQDVDEVEQQVRLLQQRLDMASKSVEAHRHELRKAEVVAASCSAGLEAIQRARNEPQQSAPNGAY